MSDSTLTSSRAAERGGNLSVVGHLTELRTRIIRCILYVAVGTTCGWVFYDQAFRFLSAPVRMYLSHGSGTMIQTGILGGFMVKMQVTVLVGLILAMPLVARETWGFIGPGLVASEKRGVKLVGPLAVLLFLTGVTVAYLIMPAGVGWLLSQNPPGVRVMPEVQQTVPFVLKMCLAFGLVFQLPVVLIFLASLGVVRSQMLKRYWRHAVVLISIISAIVTPSNDIFSMSMMCVPMVLLYFASILLVGAIERRRKRHALRTG